LNRDTASAAEAQAAIEKEIDREQAIFDQAAAEPTPNSICSAFHDAGAQSR
jgi:hypothetical protein